MAAVSRLQSAWLLLCLLVVVVASNVHHVQALQKTDDDDDDKSLRICTLAGGLDAVRLSSVPIRQVFEGALKDVELIRQLVVESARNRGDHARPLLSLEELSRTLDWEARNLSSSDTTITAGIGYVDDRADRKVEKYVATENKPFVGNKTTDLALVESAATILPWLMDRTKIKDTGTTTTTDNNRTLYTAAWIGSYGEAWLYYPPHVETGWEAATTMGDLVGGNCTSHDQQFIQPNLPPAVFHQPYLTAPYPDIAIPGHMVITAIAPVYYHGSFMGHEFLNSLEATTTGDNNSPSAAAAAGRTPLGTYVATTGIDVSTSSISSVLLENLRGTITPGSFAMVVGANQELNTVLITQSTLELLYPTHTGMEEARVTNYSNCNARFSTDRRNQTYQVSDTLVQPLTQLESGNWKPVASLIQELQPGDRSFTTIPITLTGQDAPTFFYVFFERWPDVADWATLLLVPKEELDHSVVVDVVEPQGGSLFVTMDHHAAVEETSTTTSAGTKTPVVLENKGSLDVRIEIDKIPPWLSLDQEILMWSLPAGQNLTLLFDVNVLASNHGYSGVIALKVRDADEQNNCYYEDILTINAHLTIVHLETLQAVRPYGLALSAITVMTALGWSLWVHWNESHIVVRASQPMFLHMICVGILFMGLSLIPLSMDDSSVSEKKCDKACMAFPWLLCLGFSISFAALFSKVRRINMIVSNTKKYRRVNVSVGDVMVPFVVIFSLNVTILSIWTAVDPLVWVRDTGIGDDHQGGLVASTGYCAFGEGRFAIACSVLLVLVNFSAVLLSLIQLYRARDLSATYSEGKYISMAMGSILQAFLSGIPVLLMVTDNPQVAYLVKSTIVFVVTMSLLTLTFLPKYFARRRDEALRPVPLKAKCHLSSADNNMPAGTAESATEGTEEQQEAPDSLPASAGGSQPISDISMPTLASENNHPQRDGAMLNRNDGSPEKHQADHASSWTLPTFRETFVDEDEKEQSSCIGVREVVIDASPTQPMRRQSEVEMEVGRPSNQRKVISSQSQVKPERVRSCLETLAEGKEEIFQYDHGVDKEGAPQAAANELPPPFSHLSTTSEFSAVSSIYTMPEMYHGKRLYPDLDNIP